MPECDPSRYSPLPIAPLASSGLRGGSLSPIPSSRDGDLFRIGASQIVNPVRMGVHCLFKGVERRLFWRFRGTVRGLITWKEIPMKIDNLVV